MTDFDIERIVVRRLVTDSGLAVDKATWNRLATLALTAVPDGSVKVGGRWHHVANRHILQVERDSWHIEHSLECRLSDDGMSGCDVHDAVVMEIQRDYLAGNPAWPEGCYTARVEGNDLTLDPVQ